MAEPSLNWVICALQASGGPRRGKVLKLKHTPLRGGPLSGMLISRCFDAADALAADYAICGLCAGVPARCRRWRVEHDLAAHAIQHSFVTVLTPDVRIAGAVAPPVDRPFGMYPDCDLVLAWRCAVMPLHRSVNANRSTFS